jgi:hypothetical protein
LIGKGRTLEQIKAAKVTFDYDRRYSLPEWTEAQFVESIAATSATATRPHPHENTRKPPSLPCPPATLALRVRMMLHARRVDATIAELL